MAYSIKYLFKFESAAGTTREIRVLKDGYSGDVIQRPLGRAPMLKKQQNGPVHGTSLEFYAECNVDREFIEFYTSNPKDYRVDLYAGSTLLWQGYITPELYSEPDIAPPYDVQVVATDGVGELKLYDYATQGTVTLRTLLSGLLSRTGLGTDIYLISSLKPGSAGAGSLLEKTINLDYMAGRTCYEVLTYILDTLHATITWRKGAWILTRETNVTFTNGKVRYFNTAGNSALLTDSVQALGKMRVNPVWPVGQLSTVIDPAKNKVTVQAPWHTVTCLQNPEMTSDTAWAKYNSAAYNTGTGGYYFPYPLSGTPQLRQQVSMAGIRVPLTLSVRATAATAAAGQGAPAEIGVALIYTVGGTSYHLRKETDGGLEWLAGSDVPSGAIPPRGAPVDFTQALAMWDAGRIEAEELKIENIPAFMQNGAFPAGTLTVYILGYCATVYGAYLDVVLPKGYQDILRLDNGARGEGSTVEIAIGRETADNAYYAAFLQGLLLDSGNLITSFSDANFTTGMDYLAFIARDYALSVALPRAKVTGTVFLESSVQIPPLVFTKGLLDYWLETFAWNLYEDELEIEARTLPSASLTVESETILESDGSTVSSFSGSGGSASSPMGGGGSNYFEPNEDLQTLIQLKSNYEYLGARDGLFFTGGDTSTPTPDLYVDTVNNQRVIHSRLPFYSDSFISAGGISPGGGSAGGNATLVAQTYGGTLSATGINPINFYSKERVDQLIATAGTVQTVAGVSPVSGDIPVVSLQTALSLGAAAYKAVGLVASGNTGLVTGGDVYSAINEAVSSVLKMQGTTTTAISDGSTTNPVTINGSSYTAKKGDVVMYGNKEFWWTGSAWEELGDEASWALKTTTISAGTGLTGGGTLAANRTISLSAASIASLALADTAYQKPSTGIPQTHLESALSTKVDHGESAYTNLNDWFEIVDGNIHVKGNRGFYSDSFISAGGLSSGGGSAGVDLSAVWQSLKTNTDDYANQKINAYHIPIGSGLSVVNGLIVANNAGTVTSVKVGTTTYNPTDGVVSLPEYPSYSRGTAITISSSTISVAGTVDSEEISFDPDTHSGADASNPVAWGSASGTYGIKLSVNNVTKDLVLVSGYNALASRVTALENAPEGGITKIGTYQGAVTLGANLSITENGVLSAVDTTYGVATTSAAGLMSADDKSKLNGIASGATNVTDSTVSGWGYVKSSGITSVTKGSAVSGGAVTTEGGAVTIQFPTAVTYGYASSDTAGLIKIGTGLAISDEGVVSVTGQTMGTVTRVDVGTSQYSPSSAGVVSLPAYPTTLPASDVSAWAKASSKPSYTFSELTAHPTTIAGYGITDAKIANGVITLGSNTITPLTAHQSLDGYVNALTRTPTSGGNYVSSVTKSGKTITVTYATLPTSLPASDVYSWAKAENKPSYAFSEITGTASTSQIPTLAISKVSGLQTALDGKQPLDSDLTAIAAISTGTGLLKRSVSGSTVTWSIDTTTYLSSHQTIYQLVINNSAGTAQITYKPATSGTYSLTLTKAMVGLSNVPNWVYTIKDSSTQTFTA